MYSYCRKNDLITDLKVLGSLALPYASEPEYRVKIGQSQIEVGLGTGETRYALNYLILI